MKRYIIKLPLLFLRFKIIINNFILFPLGLSNTIMHVIVITEKHWVCKKKEIEKEE